MRVLYAIFLFYSVMAPVFLTNTGVAYASTPSLGSIIHNCIIIENDTSKDKAIYYEEDHLICKEGKALSILPGKRVILRCNPYCHKSVKISGWKKKVRVREGEYLISEILLQGNPSHVRGDVRYKEPYIMHVINETCQEKRIIFTFFCNGWHSITILLHPKECLGVPYKKWSMCKRVYFEDEKRREINVQDSKVIKVYNSTIELVSVRHDRMKSKERM